MKRRDLIRLMLAASIGGPVYWKPSHSVLRAFIETIVPGADTKHPQITSVFYDATYWSTMNRWLLLFALAYQSEKLYLTLDFSCLDAFERIRVIQNGLEGKGIVSRLLHAAIWISQVMVYTGLYNEEESCALIQYPAAYGEDEIAYPHPLRYLAPSITRDGNFP